MEDAFLFQSAKRWDVKGRKYFDTIQKYYAMDLGLRNARLNFRQQERSHLMENMIYNDLIRRGYSVDVGIVELTRVIEASARCRNTRLTSWLTWAMTKYISSRH